jgi:predicted enzyme related to lactoylglutathione lyase
VEDVDAGLAAPIENGGSIVVPPTDIPPGRFACVASPSGAVFLLFHEADEASAQDSPAGNGAIHWIELHSTDLTADVGWLSASFGLTSETMEMAD